MRGNRDRLLRGPLTILAGVLLCAGCADSRISLEDLRAEERALAEVEPVQVNPEELELTELKPYTIGPGDVLTLTMVGLTDPFTELRIQVRVWENGQITLPLVGKVQVAGLDLEGVDKAIYGAYVPDFVKNLTVFTELSGPEGTTVIVTGPVDAAGPVILPNNRRNVLYALAMSGGFGPGTSGRVRVRPIRSDREELVYDLTEINDLRRALTAPPLESGDMLTIEPAEASAVYVTGLVNMPGPVPLPRNGDISLVRAVSSAGGLRDFLDPPEATLWRRLADGRQVRVKINLTDVMAGRAPDVQLHPGDVLDIPHTADTRFREWVAMNIKLGPFGVTAVYDPVADRRARILADDDSDVFRRTLLQTLGTGIPDLILPPVQQP
jgi:polysaccharide export outer membrane protein